MSDQVTARHADLGAGSDPSTEGTGTGYTDPSPTRRYEILRDARSLALVGASSNPSRASYFVASYLVQDTDYDLSFVNPRATEILGVPAYPSLADLPAVPDIVVAFRRVDQLPALAREVVALGARVLWIQLGLWSEEAASIAHAGGVEVVMDRCIKIEHARFHGGLHLGGFNTGVISSRIAQVPGQRRRPAGSVAATTTATGASGATTSGGAPGGGHAHSLARVSTPGGVSGPATDAVRVTGVVLPEFPAHSPLVCELPRSDEARRS